MFAVSYHDTVNVLQAVDAAASGPFDRAEWFALLAKSGAKPLVALGSDGAETTAMVLSELIANAAKHSQAAGITLHIENLYGSNNHHIVESCYKALARALRQAVEIDPRKADAIPSTKGTL